MARTRTFNRRPGSGNGASGGGRPGRTGRRFSVVTLLAILGLAVALTGCSTEKKERKARMICPATAVVSGTGTLTRFADGPGRTEDDIVYRAEISNLAIACQKRGDGIDATISFEISAWPGPADTTGAARIPFFVAVATKDNRMVAKKVFFSEHRFTADGKPSRFRERFTQFVPGTKEKPAKDYEILIGFQLSPDQLEYNFFR